MSEHELWNELGNLYFLGGQYQQAVHAYRRSIHLDRNFGRPYSNLALTYVQQGKYKEAIELYRQSIELLLENSEKALSWNRLGNVYRYLKDYKQAVVAYRNADEIDPAGEQEGDAPGWAAEPAHETRAVQSKAMETPMSIHAPFAFGQSEVEGSPAAKESIESTSTWAPMDPSLFQQDMSATPEPRTLTTWGDVQTDTDDPDANWPPEPGADVFFPEIDGDDLSKWIPAPEEQPVDEMEYSLEAVDLAAEAEAEEPLPAPEEGGGMILFGGIHPEPPDPIPSNQWEDERAMVMSPAPGPGSPRGPAMANEPGNPTVRGIDVIVQERPSSADNVLPEAAEVRAALAPEMQTVAEGGVSQISPEVVLSPEPQRDPEEMREIEAGLAKFRRVVQVNPKNSRAWDTLGNLYKSAGEYEEAVRSYQEAIKTDSTKAIYHHHIGLVYACQGRIRRSDRRVPERDPNGSESRSGTRRAGRILPEEGPGRPGPETHRHSHEKHI